MVNSEKYVVAKSHTPWVTPVSQSSQFGDSKPMFACDQVERFRCMNRWKRRSQEATVVLGTENIASHDSVRCQPTANHFRQSVHGRLVKIIKHLRYPDKIETGRTKFFVPKTSAIRLTQFWGRR